MLRCVVEDVRGNVFANIFVMLLRLDMGL